jgi:hypothetical protein
MTVNSDDLKKYLLNVDVELFIKNVQFAINECPQGFLDHTAHWALMYKNRYTPYNDSNEAVEDCIKHRVSLFTLEASRILNAGGYFQFLSNTSKEIYHSAKIYQHLIEIKKLKTVED